ncbi:MAG TPA: hypothetical protein VIH21_08785 [Dehalococcoidia bacterium]|jgi:xanthosine utilization system XapX-like protein
MLIYTALLTVDVAVVYYIVTSGAKGAAYVTLSIIVVVGLLLGYQVFQHYRDLRSPLAESDGEIIRKWSRADLIVAWHSYYVTVDRRVFRVAAADYVEVDEGMYVKVVHFPNTLNVVSMHAIRRPPPP